MENKGKITIRIIDKSDFLTVDIGDSGQGIPSNLLEKIFEPLFTTKSQST